MTEHSGSALKFSFPDLHPQATSIITFRRTLRIPDDGKIYPLPPDLGAFPIEQIENHKERVSGKMAERGGVAIPLYQSEALWVRFTGSHVSDHGAQWPMAVKIAAGKRSAVTGKFWGKTLEKDDYIVIPIQPWIDGFMDLSGVIRQFVAAQLGQGFTVEEQLSKEAVFGGIQIEVFPMKKEEFFKCFPKREMKSIVRSAGIRGQILSFGGDEDIQYSTQGAESNSSETWQIGDGPMACAAPAAAASASLTRGIEPRTESLGMAAGGQMKQEIYPDPYGLEVWDTEKSERVFVHLLNSMTWQTVTGKAPPTAPRTAADYARHGLPWYEVYRDGPALGGTAETAQIKSVAQLAEEKGYSILPENESVNTGHVVGVKLPPVPPKNPNEVKDGNW